MTNPTIVSHSQPNISILSPSRTPRILNQPIFLTHAHYQHRVISLWRAWAIIEDPTFVELPHGRVHGNRNRVYQQLFLKIGARVNIVMSINLEICLFFLACLGIPFVRVFTLLKNAIIPHVVICGICRALRAP